MRSLSAELGREPTQTDVRNSVLKMREEKGSLIMKDKASFKSAGSFSICRLYRRKNMQKLYGWRRSLTQKRGEVASVGVETE